MDYGPHTIWASFACPGLIEAKLNVLESSCVSAIVQQRPFGRTLMDGMLMPYNERR